jgi:hypothetical protein
LSNNDILAVQGEAIAEFGSDGSLHSSVTSTVSGATIGLGEMDVQPVLQRDAS